MFRFIVIFNVILLCSMSANSVKDACHNTSNASWRGVSSIKVNNSCNSPTRSAYNEILHQHQQSSNEWLKEPGDVITYSSMPDLFALDQYERCMSRPGGGAYCVLDVDLANVPGELYNYIMEFSSMTQKHYYHARLHRGVCVSERCGLDHETALTGTELHSCLNRTIFQESGVQVGQIKVHYCNSANKEVIDPDVLDQAVALLLAVLLLFVVSGTVHHLMLMAGWVSENKYAMAFSLIRNWQILSCGNSSDGSNTFESLQGMRFLTMLFIIGAHAFLIFAHGYVSNPKFIEEFYDEPIKRMALNGRVIVQTFFVMSGFLLTHHVLEGIDTKPLTVRHLPSAILNRIMRLLPSVLVCVGVTSTWIPRLGSGPLWDLLVRKEQDTCRANWWRQLLFIQNYFSFDMVCLPQTWYIAADTQLYTVSLLVLTVLCRYRRRGWLIIFSVLVASLAVPALQTYLQNMIPMRASLFPETFVKLFVDNTTFINAYMSAQANWAGYTLGVLTAYVHHQAMRNQWDLHNSAALKWLFYASIPTALFAMWAGAEFHTRPASRLEAVLFNALDHNVFAAAMSVFILGCIYKCDRVLRACVEWAPFQPMGRLSFCALLTHTMVLRTYMGHMPGLMHGSIYNILFLVMATTVATFVLSLLLFLMVEQPACQLQKIMISSGKKTIRKQVSAPAQSVQSLHQKVC